MPGKNERKQGSPPRPSTPPRSSPGRLAPADQHSYPQAEHSSFQALPRPANLVSRTGSSPALNLMGHELGHKEDAKRKHHPTAVQAGLPACNLHSHEILLTQHGLEGTQAARCFLCPAYPVSWPMPRARRRRYLPQSTPQGTDRMYAGGQERCMLLCVWKLQPYWEATRSQKVWCWVGQALRIWRMRPKAMAFLALATLGTLGSLALGSTGLVGLIAGSPGERARRQLASPGVPASLMATNISSAYTQAFCANKGSYLLQGQNWPDAPICQLAPTPVSTVCSRSPFYQCDVLVTIRSNPEPPLNP